MLSLLFGRIKSNFTLDLPKPVLIILGSRGGNKLPLTLKIVTPSEELFENRFLKNTGDSTEAKNP